MIYLSSLYLYHYFIQYLIFIANNFTYILYYYIIIYYYFLFLKKKKKIKKNVVNFCHFNFLLRFEASRCTIATKRKPNN